MYSDVDPQCSVYHAHIYMYMYVYKSLVHLNLALWLKTCFLHGLCMPEQAVGWFSTRFRVGYAMNLSDLIRTCIFQKKNTLSICRFVRQQRQTSLVSRSSNLVLSSRPSRSTPSRWWKSSSGSM